MKMSEVQSIARERGIKSGKMNKTDLIRTMQRQEGNPDCFKSGQADNCDQHQCLWMADCR